MDKFYKDLRQIQKKERSKSTLARVDEDFYKSIHKYLDELRDAAGNDIFSNEYNLLKDSQMIATEICERREHKITDAAVINIHRSFHLFTGKPKFNLLDTTPINLTPEEEKFYFSIIDTLKDHRLNISIDKFEDYSTDNKEKNTNELNNSSENPQNKIENNSIKSPNKNLKDVKTDDVLDKLNTVGKAKIISDEKIVPIEKQISNSKTDNLSNKKENASDENISDIYNDINNQFQYNSDENKTENNDTILIFDEIDSIVGVDQKIYGPFKNQDIVVLPHDNAKVFTKYKKARLVKI